MARPRRYALIRTLTLFSLLWIGFDLGAHGIFASDFLPIGQGNASGPQMAGESGMAAPDAPDHCFCHGLSMGAVLPSPVEVLTPTGSLVLVRCPPSPLCDPHPLDRPPQLRS
jgi:hypothetical protein